MAEICLSSLDIFYKRQYNIMDTVVDKAIRVERFFRLNSVLIGFVALRSEYASILRSGRHAAKKRCWPKIFDLKREDFFVLEVEERRNTAVLQPSTAKGTYACRRVFSAFCPFRLGGRQYGQGA